MFQRSVEFTIIVIALAAIICGVLLLSDTWHVNSFRLRI
jgi:uncharacterized integral membrane protein